jgi:hypothetical protein
VAVGFELAHELQRVHDTDEQTPTEEH